MVTPMPQTHSTPPAWLRLADEALSRLRDQAPHGTPAFPFAQRPRPKGRPLRTALTKIAAEDAEIFELFDTGFHSGPNTGPNTGLPMDDALRDPPAPEALNPICLRPDPRYLQALLRLARAFGSVAGWEACLAQGALTLVETGEHRMIEPLYTVLRYGFGGGLDIAKLADEVGELAIHRLTTGYEGGEKPSSTAARDLDERIDTLLSNPTPAIVLVEQAGFLTEAQRAPFGAPVVIPPLSRELLAAQILRSGQDFGDPGPPGDLEAALPGDDMLALLDSRTLAHALRATTLAGMIARLTVTAPEPEPAQTAPAAATGPTLAELPIPADLKAHLLQVCEDLLAWKEGRLAWSEISRGALLVGPPGVGKTETGRALARSADITFIECSLSAGLGSDRHLGESLGRIGAALAQARKAAPAILFLDELDAVGDRATSHGTNAGYERRFVTALNEMLDGFEGREGVFVIGTANHPELIDAALRRPGRFDRVMRIGLPDRRALIRILRLHLGAALPGADLDGLATDAIGATGADVAAAIRAARGLARGRREDFAEQHLAEILGATRRREHPGLARRIAVHEAGHAIVASCVEHPRPLRIAFARSGGETIYAPYAGPETRGELEGRLATLMAGREAEVLILGEAAMGSGGSAESDLAQATLLALREELSFGLGANGPLWFDAAPDPAVWFLRDPGLRARVEARLAGAAEVARGLLETRRQMIESIADAVLERRELEGEALQNMLEIS